jgi:hypothetical protein
MGELFMTKNEVIACAESEGFWLWATVEHGNKLQFMDDHGINLWVNLNDCSFEMGYIVPKSVFELRCPNCSPFGGDHFKNMYQKFEQMVIQKFMVIL